MSESILQEAERIINGDRQDTYGPPSESLGRIAVLWGAYLEREMSANEVANLLILMKVSRSKNGYHRDSYVDIAGYAGLTEKLGVEPSGLTESQWNDVRATTGQPRQWVRIEDVPFGVPVTDRTGDVFIWEDGYLMFRGAAWGHIGTFFNDQLGPFTEVIDG